MSILKAILHHYNSTSKSYDTLHPETESAQITDWHSGIMSSLASKTLGTVVDAITTDSVLGKLIKMLLNASGVKYLIDTNGYVCFGDFFGGLIIQWRTVGGSQTGAEKTETFPLAFRTPVSLVCGNNDRQGSSVDNAYAYIKDNAHFVWATRGTNGNTGSYFKTTVWALGIS